MRKKSVSKLASSKLELHEKKKKELEEELEYMRQVEVPESQGGGRKFVHDVRKEEKKQEKKKDDEVKNWLDSKLEARITYRSRLSDYGFKRIMEQNFPADWEYYCIATSGEAINIFGKSYRSQEGVLFVLRSPKGNVYVRGIKTSYNPDYDINAIQVMVIQIENTIDSEKGILLSDNKDTSSTLKKTKSGLWLPN